VVKIKNLRQSRMKSYDEVGYSCASHLLKDEAYDGEQEQSNGRKESGVVFQIGVHT